MPTPQVQSTTVSRRRALGRLLALGASAAALALPGPAQAAVVVPAEPTLPEWLTADPE